MSLPRAGQRWEGTSGGHLSLQQLSLKPPVKRRAREHTAAPAWLSRPLPLVLPAPSLVLPFSVGTGRHQGELGTSVPAPPRWYLLRQVDREPPPDPPLLSPQLGEGLGTKETPQQRYQRLQHEVQELMQEVEQIQVSISPAPGTGGEAVAGGDTATVPPSLQSATKEAAAEEELTPVALARQVEGLKQQLVSSHLEKLLGPTAAIDFADPDGALAK